MVKILMYDCEIIKCIPPRNEDQKDPNLEYCKGWKDFKGMGISVIGTWRNFATLNPFGTYEAFVNDVEANPCETVNDMLRFRGLIKQANQIIGFNSISFDDNLIRANGIDIQTTEDLLQTVRISSGQPKKYVKGTTRKGYSLKALAGANLRYNKSLTGELAPVAWQKGRRKEVIEYCLNDVKLLKNLYFKFYGKLSFRRKGLIDPTNKKTLTDVGF